MFEKVKTKLLDYVDVDPATISPDTAVMKDLGMTSFDVMSMLGELEEEFGITFEQEDVQNMVTVGDLAACITAKIQ